MDDCLRVGRHSEWAWAEDEPAHTCVATPSKYHEENYQKEEARNHDKRPTQLPHTYCGRGAPPGLGFRVRSFTRWRMDPYQGTELRREAR